MAVEGVPFRQYAQKGLFTDLYPFIDADPEYSRSDFVQSTIKAAEIDGKLYHIFPFFAIHAIISSPALAGMEMSWNIDEFNAFLDANPEARYTSGDISDSEFLERAINARADEYIDWTTGKPLTGNPLFLEAFEMVYLFLEIEKRLKVKFDEDDLSNYRFNTIERIAENVREKTGDC